LSPGDILPREEKYHKMDDFSNEFERMIRDGILKAGPISFRDFMDLCLYHPYCGYYARSRFPGGPRGDYVTGPEAHSLYGALHARQMEQFWELLGRGRFRLVEMGAGTGNLARDILNYVRGRPLYEAMEYVIVEHMPRSREAQEENLEDHPGKVAWVQDLGELPSVPGCILSNELLDAFPVHVIQKEQEGFCEVHVGIGPEGGLAEVLGELSNAALAEYVKAMPEGLPAGYRTEVNLAVRPWIQAVARSIERGFVVTVDYGHTRKDFFQPVRNRGTLLAYSGQGVSEDLLSRPGERDLTAHLNFTDLHRWGEEAGLRTVGYTPQWCYLAGCDLEETFTELCGGRFDPFSPRLAAVKMLLLPQGMGESHKVLIQAKGVATPDVVKGLRLRNRVDRLEAV